MLVFHCLNTTLEYFGFLLKIIEIFSLFTANQYKKIEAENHKSRKYFRTKVKFECFFQNRDRIICIHTIKYISLKIFFMSKLFAI